MKSHETIPGTFDKTISSPFQKDAYAALTLQDIIFRDLPHRDESAEVIYSHIEETFVAIGLPVLRNTALAIIKKLTALGLKTGDTILLASFSSSNELANALIFTSATCMGIRVFVPIFPEPALFEDWKLQTGFKAVIMPYQGVLACKGHEREKEAIYYLQAKCRESGIEFLDAEKDFPAFDLIGNVAAEKDCSVSLPPLSPETEAVIFTTSGTSGVSKLVVYTHGAFANCCRSWQQAGLFSKSLFGNAGFSPLFTHTIGIRTFINSIWSGHPFCLVVIDWFLSKPEIVRYLLLKMRLGHLIAGPAFFNTLLELFRQYPELKAGVKNTLQAAISIGAPYDEATAAKFLSATGISMMNGFGTTETLMIALNQPDPKRPVFAKSLGKLMPGVTIGLQYSGEANVYEMYIHSIFQADRTLGNPEPMTFFDTGDLVTYEEENGEIIFYGRRSSDFIKDEYGVKVPLKALREYYGALYQTATWVEWIPLVNIPGMAALLFLPLATPDKSLKKLAALVKNINEQLKDQLEPFEYAHRHAERISVVYDAAPLTRKGTVSKDQIYRKYGPLVAELRNPFVFNDYIEVTEPGNKSLLHRFSNPYMAELLEALKLDKHFIRGEGDYLFYEQNGTLQRVTDFVGGFGANLLGHNHPALREAMQQFLDSGRPALNTQGSQYRYPALLARELNGLFSHPTGRYFRALFANSGAEATELALHHAYFEWRQKMEKIRDEQLQHFGATAGLNAAEVWEQNMKLLETVTPGIIVVNQCFHGYTSGARSLLNNKKQRSCFSGLLRPRPLYLSDDDLQWEQQFGKHLEENTVQLNVFRMHEGKCTLESTPFCTIIASIIEPVRGEGGIYEIQPDLADLLARQDFPLISDEIQCGLGRTGSIPSYPHAAYYLLGKSLGGGFEKISAVLIEDGRFKPLFAKYFSSTFSNGELAAAVSLATLQLINKENLPALAAAKGQQLLSMLRAVAGEYPDVIASVNGKGLMLGIHLNPEMGHGSNFMRVLFENEALGYLLAGWLLNERHIRVLPSLSKPNSLRIEPSFFLPESEMLRLCEALKELCLLCRQKAVYELCRFLMNGDPYEDKQYPAFEGRFPLRIEQPAPDAVRVGFIGNFTAPHRELQVLEPGLQQASDTGLRILFNRLQTLMEGKPMKIMSINMLNGKVHFTFYLLPFDSSQLEVVSRWGKKRYFISKIQDAVNALAKQGAVCVSLGAHTSIITGNGLFIAAPNDCSVLTGNTVTVASCLYHLNEYLERANVLFPQCHNIAVVGAGGNIGSGLAACLDTPLYADYQITLVGNNVKRLERVRDGMQVCKDRVHCTSDLFELREADAVICCTNTNDPLIFPHHLHPEKPLFVIDISVPPGVSNEVKAMKNVHFCKEASHITLPAEPQLLFSSHSPAGKIFCCAAESILYGLNDLHIPMKGHIQREAVRTMMQLAMKEGFLKNISHAVPV